jgi:hypothetical protein
VNAHWIEIDGKLELSPWTSFSWFQVYSKSNKKTSVCECELFIVVPKMYIYTHINVDKGYLSCVGAVHFLVVLVIQILMALALWKDHTVLLPEQPWLSEAFRWQLYCINLGLTVERELTPWNRVCDNLIVAELLKEILKFCGTPRFITMFIVACQ